MELDITFLVNAPLTNYSASIHELGNDAANITWNNAKNAKHVFVSTNEEKQHARDYFKTFGAWTDKEINEWDDIELNALILQLIAGDLREYLWAKNESKKYFKHWKETSGGDIFKSGKKYYYCLGE